MYSYEIEEVPATVDGRAVLIDCLYECQGHMTQHYPQTMTSPEEPSVFEVDRETFTVIRATDVESMDELELTDALKAVGVSESEKWVEEHRDALDARFAEEIADAYEAAADAHIDRMIDERRERRMAGGCDATR